MPRFVEAIISEPFNNDMAWLRSPEKVAGQFREVAEALRAVLPHVHLLVISIKPNLIPTRRIRIGAVRKANALLAAETAAIGHATYVDAHTPMLDRNGHPRAELFTIDGIHLNEKGYRVWREVLVPRLEPPVIKTVSLLARRVNRSQKFYRSQKYLPAFLHLL